MELESRVADLEACQESDAKGGSERLAEKHREAETLSVETEKLRRKSADNEKQLRESRMPENCLENFGHAGIGSGVAKVGGGGT